MKGRHKSDSLEQRRVESEMSERLKLQPTSLTLNCGNQVKLDGFDRKRRILCEVYAHIGPLKPGQINKVAKDILKMLLVEADQGKRHWRKIYCFANEVPKQLGRNGRSWLAHSREQFGIKFMRVRLANATIASLKKAQRRQAKSVNPRAAR
jgi:hypothetical protein